MGRRKRNRRNFYFYDSGKNYYSGYQFPKFAIAEASAEEIDSKRIDVFGANRYWSSSEQEPINDSE